MGSEVPRKIKANLSPSQLGLGLIVGKMLSTGGKCLKKKTVIGKVTINTVNEDLEEKIPAVNFWQI